MGKKKQTNGDGRHNHYDLGAEIGRIKARLGRIEYNQKILRAMQPDWCWDYTEKSVLKREEIQKQIMDLLDEDVKLNFLGSYHEL